MIPLTLFCDEQHARIRAALERPLQTFHKREAAQRTRPRPVPTLDPDAPWHGTYSGYAYHGCRCLDCRDARIDYQRTVKDKTPTVGSLMWRPLCRTCLLERCVEGLAVCAGCRAMHNARHRQDRARDPRRQDAAWRLAQTQRRA